MGTDVTPYAPGGGAVALHDGGSGAVVHPSHTDVVQRPGTELAPQPMTDAEHLENYRETLGAVLTRAGIRDQGVLGKALAAAQAVIRDPGDKDLPTLADEFGQHLVRAGVTDVRTISTSLAVGFAYLTAMDEERASVRDDADFVKQRKILQDTWGTNFKANQKAVLDYINDRLPESLKDLFDGNHPARDMMGMRIGYSAAVMTWLAELALGPGKAVPGPCREALALERKEIETMMRTNPRKYQSDARMRMRYLEILAVLDD